MVLDRRMFRRPSQIAPKKGPSSKGVGITSGLTQPVKMVTGGDVASKYKEYLELLSLMESKGQDIGNLPTIRTTSKFEVDDLKDERNVEEKVVEPFLSILKYKPTDWIRQMPVRMGRGVSYYPDYCFGANPKVGEQSAKMILETKFEIKTNKDLREAYYQAKSYAVRLQARRLVIASIDGLWIFMPEESIYNFEKYFHCSWLDLENPDILHQVSRMIGKNNY